MGPQSLPVEFNLTFRAPPPEPDPLGLARSAALVGGCTFHGESATTGLPAVRSVRGKVTCGLRAGGVIALDVGWWTEEFPPRPGLPSSSARPTGEDCSQCSPTAGGLGAGSPES